MQQIYLISTDLIKCSRYNGEKSIDQALLNDRHSMNGRSDVIITLGISEQSALMHAMNTVAEEAKLFDIIIKHEVDLTDVESD